MTKILITGGAGYIGSHIVKKLLDNGYQVLVLDNFSTGFVEPLEILRRKYDGLEYINCDLNDIEKLKEIFGQNKIEVVIHLAAKIDVVESVQKPEVYYQENYLNSVNLVEVMIEAGVTNLIFSSTAAVYGDPKYTPIDENHSVNPLNPYASSKLDFEKYLKKLKNLSYVIFRYFNVGGSDLEGLIGKSHTRASDLIENALKVALGQKKIFQIFGDDYENPDGTAIRDFIHVEDISSAHILAVKKINNLSSEIINLGSESGFSVKEIIDKARIITSKEIPIEIINRRKGDIAVSIASSKKAKSTLGWNPQHSNLGPIIQSDWSWRKNHPMGYTG